MTTPGETSFDQNQTGMEEVESGTPRFSKRGKGQIQESNDNGEGTSKKYTLVQLGLTISAVDWVGVAIQHTHIFFKHGSSMRTAKNAKAMMKQNISHRTQ